MFFCTKLLIRFHSTFKTGGDDRIYRMKFSMELQATANVWNIHDDLMVN